MRIIAHKILILATTGETRFLRTMIAYIPVGKGRLVRIVGRKN